MLRGQLFDPSPDSDGPMAVRDNVYVIPNALVPDRFRPAEVPLSTEIGTFIFSGLVLSFGDMLPLLTMKMDSNRWFISAVTIVVLSRFAYRKGIDLLIAAAPRICARWPQVRFVVGKSCLVAFPYISSPSIRRSDSLPLTLMQVETARN